MASLSLGTHVDASPEVVFATASNFELLADKVRGIERIEMLTEGPIGVGSRFCETRIMFGKQATEEMEVTAFDVGQGFTLECQSCGCHYRAEHLFIADIAGTHVRLNLTSKPLTLFAKLMWPLSMLMMGSMKKCIQADLEDLKTAVESRAQLDN